MLETLPLDFGHFDLVTPDGMITKLRRIDFKNLEAEIFIEKISPSFVGFSIEKEKVLFNIKSTLAQVGVDSVLQELELDKENQCAQVRVTIHAIGTIAEEMLQYINIGAFVGKLFAADERRRVRDPDYLSRMFGRADRWGRPLLSLGGLHGSNDLILDKVDGRTVAFLTLQNGRVIYDQSIHGFLPTLGKALISNESVRDLLKLHQEWKVGAPRNTEEDVLLLVKTLPLHIRTVFGHVCNELLSQGYKHTSASILQPDTTASGDIYELYGKSKRELTDIPLEFYTLEPYREHVFFSDRDQLQSCLEDRSSLFKAFETAPGAQEERVAAFVVKGEQLLNLKQEDWVVREIHLQEFPGAAHGTRQALMVERYIEQQPAYPFLKAIDQGYITSQGVLLVRYFPSPLMKRMLLGENIQRCVKGIYFQYPSQSHQNFFSAEDRMFLNDLHSFAIPVFWVDKDTGRVLQYTQKPERESGMFVPIDKVDHFNKSTLVGVYGSNLMEGNFEDELTRLMEGLLAMKSEMNHPLLNDRVPITLITGGGPGAMEVGNRVAKNMGILSCANIMDFRVNDQSVINEQKQNPFVEGKMTYRIDKLVERQSEFNLDLPIFLIGGIGTDFEFSLEEVRRKVGSVRTTPILLFGEASYWKSKITSKFQCNLASGTIKGSEWLSNCFFCIQRAEQGIKVYRDYFSGSLLTGPEGPVYSDGFIQVE